MPERKLRTAQLREMPAVDLDGNLDGLRKEFWEARLKAADGTLQQIHRIKVLKRQMARILTIMRERRSEGGHGPAVRRGQPEALG